MNSLKETISNEVRRIIRYPSRFNLKMSGADATRIMNSLPDMDIGEIKSLREYLKAVPALSEMRAEMKEEEGCIRTYNIVCDTPKKAVLLKTYGPELKIRYRINR